VIAILCHRAEKHVSCRDDGSGFAGSKEKGEFSGPNSPSRSHHQGNDGGYNEQAHKDGSGNPRSHQEIDEIIFPVFHDLHFFFIFHDSFPPSRSLIGQKQNEATALIV
jgi:hypothetical protein